MELTIDLNLVQIALLFFVYAFLGWCCEVSFHAVVTGHFVNRGFLNGPLCPIYGFGVLLVLLLLSPFHGNGPLLFLFSILLTSALEWITGFLLEKIFHARWWDYSNEPFHLGPYVCLRFSLLWGFACVFVVYLLHPALVKLVLLPPDWLAIVFLSLFCVTALIDLYVSASSATKTFRRLERLDELAEEIHNLSDHIGQQISDGTLVIVEKQKQSKERLEEYKEQLEERIDEYKEQLDEQRQELTEKITESKQELTDKLEAQKQELTEKITESKQELSDKLSAAKAELEEKLSSLPRSQRRMLRAFPGLRSKKYQHTLERLREAIEQRKKS